MLTHSNPVDITDMSPDRHRLLTHTFVRNTCYLLMSALFPIPGMLLATDGGPPEDPVAEARTVQLARLQRHAFASDRADDKAPGLLLGNTRMGGCLAASGLGIPVLWSAELWSNSDQRLPFRVRCFPARRSPAMKAGFLPAATFPDRTASQKPPSATRRTPATMPKSSVRWRMPRC